VRSALIIVKPETVRLRPVFEMNVHSSPDVVLIESKLASVDQLEMFCARTPARKNDPTPEDQNVVLIDTVTLRKAERRSSPASSATLMTRKSFSTGSWIESQDLIRRLRITFWKSPRSVRGSFGK
jgi:hypothetical protein